MVVWGMRIWALPMDGTRRRSKRTWKTVARDHGTVLGRSISSLGSKIPGEDAGITLQRWDMVVRFFPTEVDGMENWTTRWCRSARHIFGRLSHISPLQPTSSLDSPQINPHMTNTTTTDRLGLITVGNSENFGNSTADPTLPSFCYNEYSVPTDEITIMGHKVNVPKGHTIVHDNWLRVL